MPITHFHIRTLSHNSCNPTSLHAFNPFSSLHFTSLPLPSSPLSPTLSLARPFPLPSTMNHEPPLPEKLHLSPHSLTHPSPRSTLTHGT